MGDELEYDPDPRRRRRRYHRRARSPVPKRRRYRRRYDPAPYPVRPRFRRVRRVFARARGIARRPTISVMDAAVGVIAGAIGFGVLDYLGKKVDEWRAGV